MKRIFNYLKKIKSKNINPITLKNKTKIFCIGFGKTGTTSLSHALKEMGFLMGNQAKAEVLIDEYKKRNFNPIYNYCKTAEAFQDAPFSLPFLFIGLDQKFPNSKFILSERSSGEEWYNSLVKFHTKKFSTSDNIPTKKDLINASYRYKGFIYDSIKITYDTADHDLYNKDKLIKIYEEHNQSVKDYFRYRKEDLLVMNVADGNSYERLCRFLDKDINRTTFPWKNKTENIIR